MRIRASAAPSAGRCPGLVLLPDTRPSGRAAQTGSAVGYVIEQLHRHGGMSVSPSVVAAIGRHLRSEWPDADFDEVDRLSAAYAADSRNGPASPYGVVIPESLEAEVRCQIADPTTRAEHEIVGHLDQARAVYDPAAGREVVQVWDVKSGGRSHPHPQSYGLGYTAQLAAYVAGLDASRPDWLGDRPVEAGGIVYLQAYPKTPRGAPEPDRVFLPASFRTASDARRILSSVAWLLTLIERGTVPIWPGEHCSYCPGGGAPGCLSAIEVQLAGRA